MTKATASTLVLITALVLSTIRRRDHEGNKQILVPDGKTTGQFFPKEAAFLASVGAIQLPDSDTTPDDDDAGNDPIAALVAAIGELDPTKEDHFTEDGKPNIHALKDVAGQLVTAAQRDEAWEQWQKKQQAQVPAEPNENTAPQDSNVDGSEGAPADPPTEPAAAPAEKTAKAGKGAKGKAK